MIVLYRASIRFSCQCRIVTNDTNLVRQVSERAQCWYTKTDREGNNGLLKRRIPSVGLRFAYLHLYTFVAMIVPRIKMLGVLAFALGALLGQVDGCSCFAGRDLCDFIEDAAVVVHATALSR